MLKIVLCVIVVLLLSLPALGWWLMQSSLPKADGIAVLHGLSKETAIVTDDRGVPYITASSETDLYRAQGYWVACRRLFQMDMLRRIARGELSEVFGSHCLPQDKLMRQIGCSRLADEEVKLLSKEAKQALSAYCEGVNQAILEQEGRKPLEFFVLGYYPKEWRPEDTLALMKYLHYQQEESWSLDDLRQRVLDKVGPDITSTLFEDSFRTSAPPVVPIKNAEAGTAGGAKPAPAGTKEEKNQSGPGAAQPGASGNATAPNGTAAGDTNADANGAASPSASGNGDAGKAAPGVSAAGGPKSDVKKPASSGVRSGKKAKTGVKRGVNQGRARTRVHHLSPSPPDTRQLPPMVQRYIEAIPGLGSNAFVVAGNSTDNGGCLLALDRHSELIEPNLWYACTLSTADFKVSGITIPGVPGIMYGRNNGIAWGATAYKADTQDLFIEQFSPQFPNKYKTPDGWAGAREIIEEIPCKSAFQKQNYQHKVMVTRHGPILLQSDSNAVALSWGGHDIATPQFESFYRLNRATSWQQFRNILKNYHGPTQTFLYADKSGSVGLQIAGNIPVRKESELTKRLKASQLLLGWTGTYDWTSRLEFQEMPYIYNPKEGFLVAGYTELKNFQEPITPYPVQRLQSILSSYKQTNRRPGLPDMADLQGDEYAPLHTLVKTTIQKCINKQEVIDQFQLSALKLFNQWDGYLRRQSASAAIYESFMRTVARRVLNNKLGAPLAAEYLSRWPRWSVQVERVLSQKDTEWLPSEERTFETFVVTSFAQALKDLRSKNAAEDVSPLSWEKFHKVTFKHLVFEGQPDWEPTLGKLINVGPVGVGGDADTVNAFYIDMSGKPGEFVSILGPTERLLIDMSDGDKFYETQPLGQSGHFMAPNRTDQLRAWIQANPLPVAFSDSQSERQQRHKMILTPEGAL